MTNLKKVLAEAFGTHVKRLETAAAVAYDRGDAESALVHGIRESIVQGLSALEIDHPEPYDLAFAAAVAIASGRLDEEDFWDAVL
ncbi:MAG: hypothetical protein N2690_00800 [Rhodocyclaceae bacterium]|nr:hypothetical protein [Rhodocyclaceae bacterium]